MFVLPFDIATEPAFASRDSVQISYSASMANAFSADRHVLYFVHLTLIAFRFIAPVCSLSILDASGHELQVHSLESGVRIIFPHFAAAPISNGEPEPVYCIYWDTDTKEWSSAGYVFLH